MCGIVAYIGEEKAAPLIMDALSRLEYRGYDSAGLALLNDDGFQIERSEGKLINLKNRLDFRKLNSSTGIGHTRWATHGRPSEINAHPHRAGDIVLVHNGIIENFAELKKHLKKQGCQFKSDTDTEVLAHLIASEYGPKTDLLKAMVKALKKVRGAYSIAVLSLREPNHIYAAKLGSPLIIGVGKKENFIASDVPAILPYTRKAIFLEDARIVRMSQKEIELFDLNAKKVKAKVKTVEWNLSSAEKDGYKHFMLKEIFEQDRGLSDTLRGRIDKEKSELLLTEIDEVFPKKESVTHFDRIYLIACGTSWHAALLARVYFESMLKIPVIVDYASEFRYRNPIIDRHSLLISISQSGETADTLVAVKNAKEKGATTLSICNVIESSIPRESHATVYTRTGPEIGVAATKTFTAQILCLLLLAMKLGRKSGRVKKGQHDDLIHFLLRLPLDVRKVLKSAEEIKKIALSVSQANHYLFVGRGLSFPIALEAALKLKEIAYVHAEGYTAGELKHGPIALIDDGSPVVALVSKNEFYEKMMSNVEEVISRGASVIAVGTQGDNSLKKRMQEVVLLPKTHPYLSPILEAVPVQLFAYHIANHKGLDVDQPRNLAKSVTVE